MSAEDDVRALTELYRELAALLQEIEQAVVAADTERLAELVPQQEDMIRQAQQMPLPASSVPQALARELEDAAAEAMRRNTTNHILLSEQLGLIQETMKAILGEQRAIDRLA